MLNTGFLSECLCWHVPKNYKLDIQVTTKYYTRTHTQQHIVEAADGNTNHNAGLPQNYVKCFDVHNVGCMQARRESQRGPGKHYHGSLSHW